MQNITKKLITALLMLMIAHNTLAHDDTQQNRRKRQYSQCQQFNKPQEKQQRSHRCHHYHNYYTCTLSNCCWNEYKKYCYPH
jgi:hypothetical protein